MGGNGESAIVAAEAWDKLALLDVESAVSRMLGSRSLYISMLEMFRTQLLTDMELVQRALGEGNHREALRLIHSTKGAAMILGADRLGARSEAAYTAVKGAEAEGIGEALAELLHCAAMTLGAAEEFLRSSSG